MKFSENKPYIFFSYAHREAEKSLEIIKKLEDQGYNVWYDEGIEVGTEYSDYIAEHIECCRVFVCVMNENYIASRYCLDEIGYALDNHKEVLIIYEDEIKKLNIPAGLKMRTGRHQAVFMNRSRNKDDFYRELFGAAILKPCFINEEKTEKAEVKVEKKVEDKKEEPEFCPTYEQKKKAAQLIDLFAMFGVKIDSFCGIADGPSVTRFEFIPGEKTKLAKIAELRDDISLALGGGYVRMICPIPGKGAIGIEVPKNNPEIVDFEEIYESEEFAECKDKLGFVLGKDLYGAPYCVELSRMPHLLIGGEPFSGKTSILRNIILSIIRRNLPEEAKIILMDPKGCQFTPFINSSHLYRGIINNENECLTVLSEILYKCDSRLKLFSEAGVRTVDAYNSVSENKLPRIVIFIDEAAPIASAKPAEFERLVCGIAQKGRPCGIHLVIATADISSKTLTGFIKAMIPSRIALRVRGMIESRTIIDQMGAERLCGKGDMLFCPIGGNVPLRIQAAYVSSERAAELVPARCEMAPKKKVTPIVYDAIATAVECGGISSLLLQQKLNIGYSKALKLIKELEALEILAPVEKRGQPRRVLIDRDALLGYEKA